MAIFRLFQEAMSNVTRHAEARRAEVSARVSEGCIVLEVRDDGVGVTEEQLQDEGSFGLIGMRERAVLFGGKVEITSDPGGGTRVRAVIPVGPT
jgi:signal transduction histidine kinase